MAIIPIDDPASRGAAKGFALFELGFRPFFLAAGCLAAIFLTIFIVHFYKGDSVGRYYDLITWHSHEMLFGYAMAVVAGFLLTAVRNWTGQHTATGATLAGFVGLWLLARVLPVFGNVVPDTVIAGVDFLFIPALIVLLVIPLWRAGQKKNFIFIPVLALMAAANGLVHSQMLGYSKQTAAIGTGLMVYILVLLITMVAGRVLPFFIERGADVSIARKPMIDSLAIASVIIFAALDLSSVSPNVIGWSAFFVALIHGTRLFYWHHPKLWSVPLLWVLYLGYFWMVIGFGMKGLEVMGVVPKVIALHAFTVGAVGVMTLGMMSRVALGHTGRPLEISKLMVAAYILINLAAVARVFSAWLFSQWTMPLLIAAALLWITGFIIFVGVYTPLLIQPRMDGRPG